MEIDGEEAANRHLVHYNGIDFINITNVPTPVNEIGICIYLGVNLKTIQPSDTLRVQLNNSIFKCMVIDIKPKGQVDRNSLLDSRLSDSRINRLQCYQPLVCVQLFRDCNNDNIQDDDLNHNIQDEELSNATVGIQEVAATNAIIWIHPDQIIGRSFIIHQQDAINQRYGPISNRTAFTVLRYKAQYGVNGTTCNFSNYGYDEFNALFRKDSTT